MAVRRVARRRSVLPADMVDEYLTFDCKTLSKIEKRMNAASADGYVIQSKIKRYETPETGQHYPITRFWAVMTKRVNPDNLVMALVDSELLDDKKATPQVSRGTDAGPPNGGLAASPAPKSIVKREKIYNG